jgi:hypothetical protein
VHDVGVALDLEQPIDRAGARYRDPGDVVPGEIDQHEMLGRFLGIEPEGDLVPGILLAVDRPVAPAAAGGGPGDREDLDPPAVALDPQAGLG